MDLDQEVIRIQDQWLRDNRERRRWIIVETAEGYAVHVHSRDSVSPTTVYPDKRKAAARLLQLLGLGPVAPQTHPEEACIGTVSIG